jgi:hypothetical protein
MLSDEARKIADEAKAKGLWIYSPSYKQWYSPEDFKHIFNYADANEDFLKQLQIRDPLEGVSAGFQRMSEIQNKLNTFAKRVLKYYKK